MSTTPGKSDVHTYQALHLPADGAQREHINDEGNIRRDPTSRHGSGSPKCSRQLLSLFSGNRLTIKMPRRDARTQETMSGRF